MHLIWCLLHIFLECLLVVVLVKLKIVWLSWECSSFTINHWPLKPGLIMSEFYIALGCLLWTCVNPFTCYVIPWLCGISWRLWKILFWWVDCFTVSYSNRYLKDGVSKHHQYYLSLRDVYVAVSNSRWLFGAVFSLLLFLSYIS